MVMAHFSLTLVPASSARIRGIDAIRLPGDWWESATIDLTATATERLIAGLNALLSEQYVFAGAVRIWGHDQFDEVQVLFGDDGHIEAAAIRLDPFSSSIPLIEGLCWLARDLDCVFLTDDAAVIRPTCESVVRAMLNSPSARFVRDPEGMRFAGKLGPSGSGSMH
jgi:hypothetical protein